jgi:hypothetical protein
MTIRLNIALVCAVLLLVSSDGIAQDTTNVARGSLGLRGGITWPLGDWTLSPVNGSVSMFSAGGTFDADLEFAISRRMTLAIAGGYAVLSGSDWEEYVASTGGKLTTSSYTIYFALMLRPHIIITRTDVLRIEFGAAINLPSGSETWEGRSYNYDFLKHPAYGIRGGVEYIRYISEGFGFSINVAVLIFPSGLQYTAGESQMVLSLPVTVGIRVPF